MSQTFYLKYRPQTFSDLDSTNAREELIKTFSSGKIPHAFLFMGTKGIGKTSAARIVAKAVNCENVGARRDAPEEYEPCNKCSSCISITNGSNVDVLEIDAASFTGVDDIRDLREKIRLAPSGSKYKVYIIDEVHRLSGSAFDALLKTLEEPPKHAIFILCTTELEKLPKTIVSRCQKINFKKATKKEIVDRLEKICQAEKLEFEEEALEQIVKISEGSFRDAVKILDQVSFSDKITVDEVGKIAGISGEFKPEDFLKLLCQKQAKEALLWISQSVESGVSLKILIEGCLEELRLVLLDGLGLDEKNKPEIVLPTEEVKKLIELLIKAYNEMKFAVITQLPLEMAVIEWSGNNGKWEGRSEKLNNDVGSGNETKKETKSKNPDVSLQIPASHFSLPTSNFSLEEVLQKWPLILEAVKPLNHSVLAFLKACRPKTVEGDFLILEVFYKFHKDQLEAEKSRQIFEKAASEVMNCNIKLRCTLSDEKPSKLEPPSMPPMEQKQKPVGKKEEENDIIKVAEEIFNK